MGAARSISVGSPHVRRTLAGCTRGDADGTLEHQRHLFTFTPRAPAYTCRAQIELAKMIGRGDAVAVLEARFKEVNRKMLSATWNATAGYCNCYCKETAVKPTLGGVILGK